MGENHVHFKELRHDDAGRALLREVAFTGSAEDHWPNGQRASLIEFRNGVQHGKSLGWHPNGEKSDETTYVEGCAVGLSREWHENGRPKLEMEIGENGYALWKKEWDENGNLIRESKNEE